MEFELSSLVQEILRKESDEALKLKEKREFESTVSSLNQTIRETYETLKQLEMDYNATMNEIDAYTSQLEVMKIRQNAISKQVIIVEKSLQELKENTGKIQEEIRELQNSLCESTQILSNECDISALLNKPFQHSVSLQKPTFALDFPAVPVAETEQRLQIALERRIMAIAERERLLQQPESGEEFVRLNRGRWKAAKFKNISYPTLRRYYLKTKMFGKENIRLIPNYTINQVFNAEQEKTLIQYLKDCAYKSS